MLTDDRRASKALLLGGVVVMATYLALPQGGLAQALLFLGWLSVAVGLLVARVHRGRRTLPRVWWVLAVGLGIYVVATFMWYLPSAGFGVTLGFPSPVDGLYFVSYALFGWFLLALVGRRRAGGDDEQHLAVVDAAIFTSALLALLWEGVIEPNMSASGVTVAAKAVAVAYPAFTALLFGLGARLVLSGIRAGAADLLLVGWIGGELLSDSFYGYASANATFSHGHPMELGWLGAYTAVAALATHPGFAEVSIPASRPRRTTGLGRLGLLLAAALLPIVLAIVDVANDFLLVNAAVGFVLVIVRLHLVSGDLDEQRRLADELSRLSDELQHRAFHDSLTGLGNRALLMEALERAMRRRPSRPEVATALLLIDLDGFKSVNDTLGHEAGDNVLVEATARLRRSVRAADTVARLGGDEFAVVMEDVSTEEALRNAQRIVEVLREPVRFAGKALPVRASVGVHLAEAGTDRQIVVRNADLAMYAAKALGGNRHELYEAEHHRAFVARHEMEMQLREASTGEQLHVYYQPIIDLTTNTTVGVEALLRWRHPQRGLLLPREFMDVAEASGVIVPIGRWMLEEACRQYMRWQAEQLPAGFKVTVNLSHRQLLDPLIVDDIARVLEDTGCEPRALVIEITETVFVADTADLSERLEKIRSFGVTIAMDHFGTGYSSLHQLRHLPIDIVKIDQSFVTGIADRTEDFDLATAIVKLANSLKLRTLADGVETPEQLALLRALDVDQAQGSLFAPALRAEDVARGWQRS